MFLFDGDFFFEHIDLRTEVSSIAKSICKPKNPQCEACL